MDVTETLAPRSDQVNADDLTANPRTVQILEVRPGSAEQPVEVVTDVFGPGRPYKPGKSMRRVMAAMWGTDSTAWVGHRVTLYNDTTVTFGKDATGGIRISHASGIDKPLSLPLTVTRGKRKPFTVQPLADAPAPTPQPTEADVAACTDTDTLRTWWTNGDDQVKALVMARKAELEQQADTATGEVIDEEPPA